MIPASVCFVVVGIDSMVDDVGGVGSVDCRGSYVSIHGGVGWIGGVAFLMLLLVIWVVLVSVLVVVSLVRSRVPSDVACWCCGCGLVVTVLAVRLCCVVYSAACAIIGGSVDAVVMCYWWCWCDTPR